MIKIPKDVHKALAVLFKHKLISEIERQQLMEKSMRRDLSARIVQLPKPREATVALEKTLSEIRAALDEILRQSPDLKAKLYPPKAHGEGSRSKLHSYGLKNLAESDYEIRGK